jgi:hypothetical protein
MIARYLPLRSSLSGLGGLAGAFFVALLAGCPTGSDPAAGGDGGGADGVSEAGPPPCGRLTALCADGATCEASPDCVSRICSSGICQTPAPADGVKNGDETDVDCGGTKAPACPTGKGCIVATDCASIVCTSAICQAPTATDGVKNGDETGVDCGGATAPRCGAGQGCLSTADCKMLACDTVQKKCLAASHMDGFKNDGETGIDCGGAALPAGCGVGEGCVSTADCKNTPCNATTLVCDPPTKTDGIKNGTETDVDCGGGAPTNAPRCADDRACGADGDCASTFCSGAGRCVAGRSCKASVAAATSGIVTCGKRETGDATAVHESCCRTLPLPVTTSVRLDKYEVTAGRMRQFVETVGADLRTWAKTEMAAATPLGVRLSNDLVTSAGLDMSDLLPKSATPGDPLNLVQQIGATVIDSRRPSMSQGCFNSSAAGAAYGANTYYWDGATLRAHFAGHADRRFTKAQYDEKSMNCGAYWMYAAFCAWDGGRMPTEAEMNEAWGATAYPWGTATFGFPLDNMHQGPYQYEQTANYFNNAGFYFYHYPDFGDGADLAGFIAAPGRFILDRTAQMSANAEHWMDLGANVMELTRFRTPAVGNDTFCDFSITNAPGDVPNLAVCNDGGVAGVVRKVSMPSTVWVGGSWEGHQKFTTNPAAEPWFSKLGYTLPVQTQYGKTGVRCAR